MALRIHPAASGTAEQPAASGPPLVVCIDHAAQPYSLGDLLVLVVASMVRASELGAARVRYAVLSDPDRPNVDPVMAAHATREDHLQRVMALLPALQLDPRFDEAHLFTSTAACHFFLERSEANGAVLWPDRPTLEAGTYLYYGALQAIAAHHGRLGHLPALHFAADLRRWTSALFQRLAPGRVPVSANLRNNLAFHPHRNADLDAWAAFFRSATAAHPVAFFVTGAPNELDARIRICPQVFYTKDHHAGLLEDLAVVRQACFHMGSASGPVALSFLLENPYYIAHTDAAPYLALYGGALLQAAGGELRFSFAGPHQALGTEPETTALLLERFEALWASRDWVASLPGAAGPQ